MDLSLAGKRALVGGASRGIGRATAFELASMGAQVCCLARNEEHLKELVGLLDVTHDQQHDFIAADSGDPHSLSGKVAVKAESGAFHIVINNTGGPPDGPACTAEVAAFEAAFTQHVICSHTILQAVLPGMRESGYGRIINVISTSVKQPIPGLGVSNTIRGAMASWSKTLAGELGRFGITVNNVLPGFTETDRLDEILKSKTDTANGDLAKIVAAMKATVPVGRFGQASETAAAIAFLASPAAAYISGINLPVDGGRTGSL
jgi:3-oxoacyl-[acyl-carrier protein] reductase